VRTYAELVGRGKGERPFAAVPLADAARYCAADSEIVLRLRDAFLPELEDHQLVRLLETIEMPLMPVLVDMESRGVCIDLTRLARSHTASPVSWLRSSARSIKPQHRIQHQLDAPTPAAVVREAPAAGPQEDQDRTLDDYEVLEQLAAMGHEVPGC